MWSNRIEYAQRWHSSIRWPIEIGQREKVHQPRWDVLCETFKGIGCTHFRFDRLSDSDWMLFRATQLWSHQDWIEERCLPTSCVSFLIFTIQMKWFICVCVLDYGKCDQLNGCLYDLHWHLLSGYYISAFWQTKLIVHALKKECVWISLKNIRRTVHQLISRMFTILK